MDWYFGNGGDDLVVPNDGGSDRLPSPDSWSKWGISQSECFQPSNKCFSMYPQFTKNFAGKGLYEDVDMGTSVNDKDLSSSSSICEEMSEDSLQRTSHPYNYNQLEDLAGLQQMDDIFLSSLLEDLPGAENVHRSFFFRSDSSDILPTDTIPTSPNLESQSISSSVHSAGSSKYLQTHAFSPELGSEKRLTTSSQFSPCKSEQKDCPPVKGHAGRLLSPSEHGSMHGRICEETSVEESVLQELEMVMAQLTEKTRLCFRDSLYRLANNSKVNHVAQSQDGDHDLEMPSSWTDDDEMARSSMNGTELETNTIDRAIANLMFNEIDFNAQDISGGASDSSNQEINGGGSRQSDSSNQEINGGGSRQQADNSYRPQSSQLHQNSLSAQDAEVPILGQKGQNNFSANNVAGKRKTPMSEFRSTSDF